VKRPHIRQWYRFIPTGLTLGNSLCGFGAILNLLHIYAVTTIAEGAEILGTSAWLIVGAMIFDMLDGWIARMLNAMSLHGAQMDSLADMVTFGVAPAVMVAVMAHTLDARLIDYRWVWALCAVYMGCAALRLALYNVHAIAGTGKPTEFSGLPSPGAAAAVVTLVLFYTDPKLDADIAMLSQLLPVYAGVIGLLMVSPIEYPHVGRWLGSARHNKLKMLAVITLGILYGWRPRLITMLAANAYVLAGPVAHLVRICLTRLPVPPPDTECNEAESH